MRVISVMILVSLLSACSAPWHAEKPVPAAETRQQTCQPGSNPSQNDCGHFPEPEFHCSCHKAIAAVRSQLRYFIA